MGQVLVWELVLVWVPMGQVLVVQVVLVVMVLVRRAQVQKQMVQVLDWMAQVQRWMEQVPFCRLNLRHWSAYKAEIRRRFRLYFGTCAK